MSSVSYISNEFSVNRMIKIPIVVKSCQVSLAKEPQSNKT
jgi:hypothetical protein